MGAGALSRGESSRGVKLTTHLYLVPRLRMRGAIPLLPQYAFIAWTGKTVLFTCVGGKMLDCDVMVASIPLIQSAVNLFMNEFYFDLLVSLQIL